MENMVYFLDFLTKILYKHTGAYRGLKNGPREFGQTGPDSTRSNLNDFVSWHIRYPSHGTSTVEIYVEIKTIISCSFSNIFQVFSLECSIQREQSKNTIKLIFRECLSPLATSQNTFWRDCFTAWKIMAIFVQDVINRRRGHHQLTTTTTKPIANICVSSNGMFMFQQGLVY